MQSLWSAPYPSTSKLSSGFCCACDRRTQNTSCHQHLAIDLSLSHLSLLFTSSAPSQSPPSSSSPQPHDSSVAGYKNLSSGVPTPWNYSLWFMKWWTPAQCYLSVTPLLPFINRCMNLNKYSKFLCFPLSAFPSHLSFTALHNSPLSLPLSSYSSLSHKAGVKTMSFPWAVNQSYKLKPCSQRATRNEKVYVPTHMCKCMSVCVKTLPLHQGLQERVETFRRNLSGNWSKLQVFSSFKFLFQFPPQLSAFIMYFFPLERRVLLLAGTRLNYRLHLFLVWNQQLHGSMWADKPTFTYLGNYMSIPSSYYQGMPSMVWFE